MERRIERKSRRRRHLPQDVLYSILLMLPAKSLSRFKTVCKLWNNIISNDHKFAELHREQKHWTRDLRLFFSNGGVKEQHWIYEFDEQGTKARSLYRLPNQHQLHPDVGMVFIEASLGSLLLLKVGKGLEQLLHMYDCITGKKKVLPCLNRRMMILHEKSLVHDVLANMYKVLVISSSAYSKLRNCIWIISVNGKSLRAENSWRMLRLSPFAGKDVTLRSSVSIRGILYWLVRAGKSGGDYGTMLIQPFNIAKEKFTKTISIPLPGEEPGRHRYENCSLLQIRGSLCYMQLISDFEFGIWNLKDSARSSWVQLHKISLQSMTNRPPFFRKFSLFLRPIFVLENINNSLPRILLRHYPGLYWYDMNTEEIQQIEVEFLSDYHQCCEVAWVPY